MDRKCRINPSFSRQEVERIRKAQEQLGCRSASELLRLATVLLLTIVEHEQGLLLGQGRYEPPDDAPELRLSYDDGLGTHPKVQLQRNPRPERLRYEAHPWAERLSHRHYERLLRLYSERLMPSGCGSDSLPADTFVERWMAVLAKAEHFESYEAYEAWALRRFIR